MHKYKAKQSIFFIIIPLLMLFIAFIFDFILIFIQDTRVEYATKDIIKDTLTYNVTDYYKNVKESYEEKKITTKSLEVSYNDGYLTIYNSYSYTSFFGKIIGINNYRSEVNLTGYKENDKIIFKEVHDE